MSSLRTRNNLYDGGPRPLLAPTMNKHALSKKNTEENNVGPRLVLGLVILAKRLQITFRP